MELLAQAVAIVEWLFAFARAVIVAAVFADPSTSRTLTATGRNGVHVVPVPDLLARALLSQIRRPAYPQQALRATISGLRIEPALGGLIAAFGGESGANTTAVFASVFPCLIELLTMPAFPFPLLGGVHVRSRLTALRPFRTDGGSTGSGSECFVSSAWDPRADVRRVKRGYECDIHMSVYSAERSSSSGTGTVQYIERWKSTNTFLMMTRGNIAGAPQSAAEGATDGATAMLSAVPFAPSTAVVGNPIVLPADLGRRWAAVTGDFNPIHVSALAAKLFGFRGTIAHGMCVLHQAMAQLPAPASQHGRGASNDFTEVDVVFVRPAFLSSTVSVRHKPSDGGTSLQVLTEDGSKVLIAATVR
jgi:acyl dehydratase